LASASPRQSLAAKRLLSVLRAHTIATGRTLEQKISDAGPTNQRIDPHVLTPVRKDLVDAKTVAVRQDGSAKWYHLTAADAALVEPRYQEQRAIFVQLQEKRFTLRVGQALEIAVYRALLKATDLMVLGAYKDLDDHDDSALYSKEEPPSSVSGKSIPGDKRLDFVVAHRTAGLAGLEVKNVREWLYPNRDEIKDMLFKCCHLGAVPVLIARRIPYVTFSVLNTCGVLLHQTYNQRFARADEGLAALARDKHLMGYHDVRVGNEPDSRLERFLGTHLPKLLPDAREKFDEYSDLLEAYGSGAMGYDEFAGRVGRRRRGENEDGEFPTPDEY
jgi:hypothetical protein